MTSSRRVLLQFRCYETHVDWDQELGPFSRGQVLQQDEWWVDRNRVRWSPRAMTDAHLQSALTWIPAMARSHAYRLYRLVASFPPQGEHASDDVDRFLAQADHEAACWWELPVARMLQDEINRRTQ